MQAVESQTLILYHTDLRGQWPRDAARALAARLPYPKRLTAGSGSAASRASLAGIALALRALTHITARTVDAGEIVFTQGLKPRLACAPAPSTASPTDFSISHAGPWVGCAAVPHGRVGFDIETGADARIARWVAHEALLKAAGAGVGALREVRAVPFADGRARWRDELWHARALDLFPGASACVMTSVAVRELEVHGVPLAELFAS
jgi:phosphopantetheinyl transferase